MFSPESFFRKKPPKKSGTPEKQREQQLLNQAWQIVEEIKRKGLNFFVKRSDGSWNNSRDHGWKILNVDKENNEILVMRKIDDGSWQRKSVDIQTFMGWQSEMITKLMTIASKRAQSEAESMRRGEGFYYSSLTTPHLAKKEFDQIVNRAGISNEILELNGLWIRMKAGV